LITLPSRLTQPRLRSIWNQDLASCFNVAWYLLLFLSARLAALRSGPTRPEVNPPMTFCGCTVSPSVFFYCNSLLFSLLPFSPSSTQISHWTCLISNRTRVARNRASLLCSPCHQPQSSDIFNESFDGLWSVVSPPFTGFSLFCWAPWFVRETQNNVATRIFFLLT